MLVEKRNNTDFHSFPNNLLLLLLLLLLSFNLGKYGYNVNKINIATM